MITLSNGQAEVGGNSSESRFIFEEDHFAALFEN
jgi:hypothetical protein